MRNASNSANAHMNPFNKSNEECRSKLLDLLAKDAYRFGDFNLSSGRTSNHYVNCKPVTLNGLGLILVSKLLLLHVETKAEAVAGLTLGADPLVSGVAIAASQLGQKLNGIIVRKKSKGHGTGACLEGPLPPKGSLITVLEDVVTTGGSSLKAVNELREYGYLVNKVVSIVDREEGGEQNLKKEGLELISIFLLQEIASRSKEV